MDILGKTESIIALRQQELQKLDDIIKARFVEMFGDPETNPMGGERNNDRAWSPVLKFTDNWFSIACW